MSRVKHFSDWLVAVPLQLALLLACSSSESDVTAAGGAAGTAGTSGSSGCEPGCLGCCSNGQCLAATTSNACGTAGAECQTCGPEQICAAGACSGVPKVVLFGGSQWEPHWESTLQLGDTWVFDGAMWKELYVPGPAPRKEHAMARLGDKIVLFGGLSSTEELLGDTWVFDGTSWAELGIAGPSARFAHVMVSQGDEILLHGGRFSSNISTPPLDDTWTFDGTAWSQIGDNGPALLEPAAANVGGNVVLAGTQPAGITTETWTHDGTAWHTLDVQGPATVTEHAMVEVGDTIWLYSGHGVVGPGTSIWDGPYGELWSFDGASWTQVFAASPAGRSGHAMTILRDKAVMYGGDIGFEDPSAPEGFTWTFDGANWGVVKDVAPGRRQDHAMTTLPFL